MDSSGGSGSQRMRACTRDGRLATSAADSSSGMRCSILEAAGGSMQLTTGVATVSAMARTMAPASMGGIAPSTTPATWEYI